MQAKAVNDDKRSSWWWARFSSNPSSPDYEFPKCRFFLRFIFTLALFAQLCFDVWVLAPSILQPLLKNVSIMPDSSSLPYRSTNPQRIHEIVSDFNHQMAYVPSLNCAFVTMAKSGSSTLWRTVFTGLTGSFWSNRNCGYVHNLSSDCWGSNLQDIVKLPLDRQFDILVSNSTNRIAVQREPFSRIVSAFKNKIACGIAHANPEFRYSERLRINANLTPGPNCMNISEFANVLDSIRTHFGENGFLNSWSDMDRHFVPQNYYADDIYYHSVFDVADLSNLSKLSHIIDRFPFAHIVRNSSFHFVKSVSEDILIDDKSAQKLHRFAQLAVTIPPRP